MGTVDGLLDIIAVGCVLEFGHALSRARYARTYDPSSDDACEEFAQDIQARTFFRVIMKVFATKFGLLIDNKIVHPSYLWQRILVGFAAAVVTHMVAKGDVAPMAPGMTPTTVQEALRLHLQVDHPHLVAPFNAALEEDPSRKSLTWDGPDIIILPKTNAFQQLLRAARIREQLDLKNWPIRHPGIASGIEAVDQYYLAEWPAQPLHNAVVDDSD